jgi:glutamate dehydrogenase
VPEGAKGGFFLKNAARDLKAERRRGRPLYKTFIRGLLDVTDNYVQGEIVRRPGWWPRRGRPLPRGRRRQGHGAPQSTPPTALSLEYGFWLGDAFASGGAVGYDHKKVGITARGGWVLVKRHFAEMGLDPYKQDVHLRRRRRHVRRRVRQRPHRDDTPRLLAAFNHVHIFLDPEPRRGALLRGAPPPVQGRRRLGQLRPRASSRPAAGCSTAGEVDPALARGASDARPDAGEAPPEVVIRAILRMQVDLLWNGGIGTYVKASSETHADADDRDNDALRVSANELRCRWWARAGTSASPRPARIEARLRGVRLNTDAIDNSGGVDLSDHEVNLKILLARRWSPAGR